MEKKHAAIGALVVAALLAWLVAPTAQWGLFRLRAQDTVFQLERFPDAARIVSLPDRLREDVRRYKLDPAQVEVTLRLEPRAMGPVTFHFLTVRCARGGQVFTKEHRVETPVDDAFLDALEAGGVQVVRRTE